MVQLAPSILSADFANLERDIKELEACNIRMLHLDLMDGCFVPNITFGPDQVKMLRDKTEMIFDAHMMIQDPDRFIPNLAEAGADIIRSPRSYYPFTPKYSTNKGSRGKSRGILNPATPIETIEYVLDDIDLILIMTVNPGFGGQKFIPSMLEKISRTRR